MAKTIRFTIGVHDEGLWARVQPELRDPDDAHISQLLRWILEQVNFGQWEHTTDDRGRLTSIPPACLWRRTATLRASKPMPKRFEAVLPR